MKLTVLGCWAPYQRAGGACSGYLLQNNNNIMIDCGNGVLAALQNHLDFRTLDAVIISHFHPDHYLDLFCLRHAVAGAIRDGSLTEPLPLYIPATPAEIYAQLAGYTEAFRVEAISEERAVKIGNTQISFLRTKHALETYALKAGSSPSFGYTADTRFSESLLEFFKGIDCLLTEASVMEKDKEYAKTGHLTVKQAAGLGMELGVSRLLMTHFWPEYNLQSLIKEAREVFPTAEIVEEGRTYNIGV